MKAKTAMLLLAATVAACTNEGYESGDGRYSDMRADFVEAQTDGSGAIISFETDDGEAYNMAQAYKPQWTKEVDSTYRALIYYNPMTTATGNKEAELVMLRSVSVPAVRTAAEFTEGVKTDPVTLNSVWLSGSMRYLNLDISLKTGTPDDEDARQTLGIALENSTQNEDGSTTTELTLYHDQGTVPEYYSSECFVSVPLYRGLLTPVAGDTIRFNITTYKGLITKTFRIE